MGKVLAHELTVSKSSCYKFLGTTKGTASCVAAAFARKLYPVSRFKPVPAQRL